MLTGLQNHFHDCQIKVQFLHGRWLDWQCYVSKGGGGVTISSKVTSHEEPLSSEISLIVNLKMPQ